MKKALSLLLALALCLSLCACSTNHYAATPTAATQDPNLYPPEGEYDTIVMNDDRYFLCKKTEDAFSENKELYGIYDTQTRQWSFPYVQLFTDDMGSYFKFYNNGNGVFSYLYSSMDGEMMFLSAEYGSAFGIFDHVYNRESIYFDDGKALVLTATSFSGYKNGSIPPTSKLYWVDVYGEETDIYIPGFPEDSVYWSQILLSERDHTNVYVRAFESNDQNYIYVYFYDTNKYVVIDDQDCASRVNSTEVQARLAGDTLIITNMEGADGNKYYMEFDRDGNVVTEATRIGTNSP